MSVRVHGVLGCGGVMYISIGILEGLAEWEKGVRAVCWYYWKVACTARAFWRRGALNDGEDIMGG